MLFARLSYACGNGQIVSIPIFKQMYYSFSSAVSAWKQEIISTLTTTRPVLRTAHALLALSGNVPGQSAPLRIFSHKSQIA